MVNTAAATGSSAKTSLPGLITSDASVPHPRPLFPASNYHHHVPSGICRQRCLRQMFPQNVIACIDRQHANIDCYSSRLISTQLPFIGSRPVNVAGTTDRISSCEDVTIKTDRTQQTLIDLLPSPGAYHLIEKCQSVRAGKNGITRVNRDCPNARRLSTHCFSRRQVLLSSLERKKTLPKDVPKKMSSLGFAAKERTKTVC
jgi:hypothetical protein